MDDTELALSLATEASSLLLRLRPGTSRSAKPAYDECAGLLLGGLRAERPEDGVLYAGTADDPVRHERPRVWIVDPLYDRAAYGSRRETDFYVHIALWDSDAMVTGAIGLPAHGLVLGCAPGPYRGLPRCSPEIGAIGVGSPGSRLAGRIARTFGARLVRFRSHGASAVGALLGTVDAHIVQHPEGEWCSAAAVAVANATGMHTSRIHGAALHYNQRQPVIHDLLICPAPTGPAVVARIQEVRDGPSAGPA
jgi:3'(2'), 5'-bisphosphate nucleotidase